jgi:hypothetical protein
MPEQEKLDRDTNIQGSERVHLPDKRDLGWGNRSPEAQDAVSDTATAAVIDLHDYDTFEAPLRYTASPERTVERLDAEYVEWYWNPEPPVQRFLASPDLEKAYRIVSHYVGWSLVGVGLGALTVGLWSFWKQCRKPKAPRTHARDWGTPEMYDSEYES